MLTLANNMITIGWMTRQMSNCNVVNIVCSLNSHQVYEPSNRSQELWIYEKVVNKVM